MSSLGIEKKNIFVGIDEFRLNNEAIEALKHDESVFVRGGQLVMVISTEEGPKIVPVLEATLRERLTIFADFYRLSEEGDPKGCSPPKPCVQAILARGQWSGLRKIVMLADSPIVLADGTVIQKKGYHASGIYYAPRHDVNIDCKSRPTLGDSKAAAKRLLDVLDQFPFVADHHRSAWLAALITPLARHAFAGPTPFFLLSGNIAGAGKGKLIDVIAAITTGERGAKVSTYPSKSDEEARKVITTLLREGKPIVSFDNLEGNFGGGEINRLLTSVYWNDRLLGTNRDVTLPNLTTWFGNGNNISIQGDTLRRVCQIRLESILARPEERTDLKIPKLIDYVIEHRAELLSAAIAIVRAYILAGKPDVPLLEWQSYENWSSLVRAAIVWAEYPDPALGRQEIREQGDEKIIAMPRLLELWPTLDPDNEGITVSRLIAKIDYLGDDSEVGEILDVLVGSKPRFGEDKRAEKLGKLFRENQKRVFEGGRALVISGTAGGKVKKWKSVTAVASGDSGDRGDVSTSAIFQDENPRRDGLGISPPSPASPPPKTVASTLTIEARLNEWNGTMVKKMLDDSKQAFDRSAVRIKTVRPLVQKEFEMRTQELPEATGRFSVQEIAEMAEQARVSERMLRGAVKVSEEAPELMEPIREGRLSVGKALKVARLPKSARERVAQSPDPKAQAVKEFQNAKGRDK